MMRLGKHELSWRTFSLLLGGFCLLVLCVLAGLLIEVYLPAGRSEAAAAVLTDVGSVVFGLIAAGFLFFAAAKYQVGNPTRRIFQLLGMGVILYALGDIIWTVLDVRSGFTEVPYPSVADVPYIAMYFFMAAALFRAARAFRRVARVDVAVAAVVITMFLGAVAMYWFVVAPIIVDETATLPQKVLGAAYPIGDLVVLLGPAVFIAFVASIIGKSQPVLHWWMLALGLAVMSISDIVFTWLDWTGRYYSGHPVDYGWMLSLLMMAIAGSVAADVRVDQGAPVKTAGAARR